ncbi:hypothetical protein IOCL2690_000652600 [Leishmania lindenbergi]|uniref:Uncharacterized protein n=1 Tax=Leishmania lindenbergi TaxID=651832 RepID=A0AAW3A1M8_9TRYP
MASNSLPVLVYFLLISIVVAVFFLGFLYYIMSKDDEELDRAETPEAGAEVDPGNRLTHDYGNSRVLYEPHYLQSYESEYQQHHLGSHSHEQPVMAIVREGQPNVGIVVADGLVGSPLTARDSVEYGEAVYMSEPDRNPADIPTTKA